MIAFNKGLRGLVELVLHHVYSPCSALLYDCLFAPTEKGSACPWSLDRGGLSSTDGGVPHSVCQYEGVHYRDWCTFARW